MSIEIEAIKVRNGLMSIPFPIEICVEKQFLRGKYCRVIDFSHVLRTPNIYAMDIPLLSLNSSLIPRSGS